MGHRAYSPILGLLPEAMLLGIGYNGTPAYPYAQFAFLGIKNRVLLAPTLSETSMLDQELFDRCVR